MRCKIIGLVLLLLTPSTYAGPILTYDGNTFIDTGTGPGQLVATLEIGGPLANGATLTAEDIVTYSITAAGRTITNLDAPTFAFFDLRIGANLLPNLWQFEVELNVEGWLRPEQWTSRNGLGPKDFDAFSLDDSSPNNILARGSAFSAVFSNPGVWAVSEVPEPSTIVLLACGFLGLGFTKRKMLA